MKTVYEILDSEKMCEKVIVIDEYHKRKVTKVVHGDVGYLDEANESQVRNVARLLNTEHPIMDEVDGWYRRVSHNPDKGFNLKE